MITSNSVHGNEDINDDHDHAQEEMVGLEMLAVTSCDSDGDDGNHDDCNHGDDSHDDDDHIHVHSHDHIHDIPHDSHDVLHGVQIFLQQLLQGMTGQPENKLSNCYHLFNSASLILRSSCFQKEINQKTSTADIHLLF